jgi:hypothetical protein
MQAVVLGLVFTLTAAVAGVADLGDDPATFDRQVEAAYLSHDLDTLASVIADARASPTWRAASGRSRSGSKQQEPTTTSSAASTWLTWNATATSLKQPAASMCGR